MWIVTLSLVPEKQKAHPPRNHADCTWVLPTCAGVVRRVANMGLLLPSHDLGFQVWATRWAVEYLNRAALVQPHSQRTCFRRDGIDRKSAVFGIALLEFVVVAQR